MNLIVPFLAFAAICVGIALAALGSPYLGILLVFVTIIVAAGLRMMRQHRSSLTDFAGRQKAFRSTEP